MAAVARLDLRVDRGSHLDMNAYTLPSIDIRIAKLTIPMAPITVVQSNAEDLLDFTFALLERMYTEPERLRLAKERRDARRAT